MFGALDKSMSAADSDETLKEEEKEKENEELLAYYEKLLEEQNVVESGYAVFKSKHTETSVTVNRPERDKPTLKLTALTPPAWNGVKADFFTWKKKFEHIMNEAKVHDSMTQLCYLQTGTVLPKEYKFTYRTAHQYLMFGIDSKNGFQNLR